MLKNYSTDLYFIQTLTNLHAGSGDSNYGIVDKEVQRDSIENIPVINASSMKGALREMVASRYSEGHKSTNVEQIFGSDTSARVDDKEKNGAKPGSHYFFEARLLSLPVRSNVAPFFHATSPEILSAFISDCRNFNVNKEKVDALEKELNILISLKPEVGSPMIQSGQNVRLEDFTAIAENKISNPLFDGEIALFNHADLKELCRRLPIIARNNLENGVSKNLWYEEVVPRQTRFYTFVSKPEKDANFETELEINKHSVQIGANATIGYGQCTFSQKLKTTKI
jgi:CRISPR-associated protein Cmr4